MAFQHLEYHSSLTVDQIIQMTRDRLLTQGCASKVGDKCRYRSLSLNADGDEVTCACAIGHWIADDRYNESIEGYQVNNNSEVIPVLVRVGDDMPRTHRAVFKVLQVLHDSIDVSKWEQAFDEFQEDPERWLIRYAY